MQIENEFEVAAPPDRVYTFLLDVNRVVTCMPGAELSEVMDPNTFKGRVRIKVGPITVAYNGTASIAERDETNRSATLKAEGRETTGPGSARATAVMTVQPADGGSRVRLVTDYTVAGRVANFGRGVMEDVSRRLVSQMADCIKANLEAAPAADAEPSAAPAAEPSAAPAAEPSAAPAAEPAAAAETPATARTTAETAPGAGGTDAGTSAAGSPPGSPAAPAAPASRPAPPAPARPVNALSLFFAVLRDRIKRLFRRRRA